MRANKALKQGLNTAFRELLLFRIGFILLVFFGIISAVTQGIIPYVLGLFFDSLIEPEFISISTFTLPNWIVFLAIFAFTQFLSDIIQWLHSKKSITVGHNVFAYSLQKYISHILKLPLSFHKQHSVAETTDTLNKASFSLATLISDTFANLPLNFLTIIISFVVAFLISWKLALILLVGLLLFVFILAKKIRLQTKLAKKEIDAKYLFFRRTYDAVLNYQTVKSFNTEQYEERRFKKFIFYYCLPRWLGALFHRITISFNQDLIITATRIAIFISSVYLIRQGELSIGELLALNGYAAFIFAPFLAIIDSWDSIQRDAFNINKVEQIHKEKQEAYNPSNSSFSSVEGSITFQNVSFAYEKKNTILRNISFHVEKGEVVALVGRSGVGKSTLIDLISAYHFAQQGAILMDGVNIKQVNLNLLRRSIALLPQEPLLFNDTLLANLKYGVDATRKELDEAIKLVQLDDFVKKLPKKLNTHVGERGIKLSVGQKQRIALIRLLLRDPKILILDEPTSALDAKTEHLITDIINKKMKDRTTFIIAHRLSTVRKADKIFVLKKGRLVEQGTHSELIKKEKGVYKEL